MSCWYNNLLYQYKRGIFFRFVPMTLLYVDKLVIPFSTMTNTACSVSMWKCGKSGKSITFLVFRLNNKQALNVFTVQLIACLAEMSDSVSNSCHVFLSVAFMPS